MEQTKLMVQTTPMVQTQTYGTAMDSWYRHGLIGYIWTYGIDMDSWYRHRLMVLAKTHDMYIDLWY